MDQEVFNVAEYFQCARSISTGLRLLTYIADCEFMNVMSLSERVNLPLSKSNFILTSQGSYATIPFNLQSNMKRCNDSLSPLMVISNKKSRGATDSISIFNPSPAK
jgi:hypothetical protein